MFGGCFFVLFFFPCLPYMIFPPIRSFSRAFQNTEIPSLDLYTDGRMDGRKKAEYYTKICGVEPNGTKGEKIKATVN